MVKVRTRDFAFAVVLSNNLIPCHQTFCSESFAVLLMQFDAVYASAPMLVDTLLVSMLSNITVLTFTVFLSLEIHVKLASCEHAGRGWLRHRHNFLCCFIRPSKQLFLPLLSSPAPGLCDQLA